MKATVTSTRTVSAKLRDYVAVGLSCGHYASDRDYPGAVSGDVVDCHQCARNAAARQKVLLAAAEGRLSHTRKARVGSGVDAYEYDRTSPTGVRHLANLDDTPETHAFLRSIRPSASPLSPTEAR